MQYRIMLVDDELNVLRSIRRVLNGLSDDELEGHSLEIELFTSPVAALQRADYVSFDLVMSDYRMPEMSGVEFFVKLKNMQPNAMRLILSGYADLDGLIGAINEAQIFRFIAKPWHDYDLQSAIMQALSFRYLLLENQRLADLSRVQEGKLTKQELELKRLEDENPGITKVNWGPDGSVMLDL
jgi:two-component system, probable response regulator PhcQ